MTLALLLAAFLAIVLAFGLLVAVHDAVAAGWQGAAARRLDGCAAGAPWARSRTEAGLVRQVGQRGRQAAGSCARAWSATAPARAWRHLH